MSEAIINVRFKDGITVSRNVVNFPVRNDMFISYFAATFDIPPESVSSEDKIKLISALKDLSDGAVTVTVELDYAHDNTVCQCRSLIEFFTHYLQTTRNTFFWINYATWKDFTEKIRTIFIQDRPPRGFKKVVIADAALIKSYDLTAGPEPTAKIEASGSFKNVLPSIAQERETVFILEDPDMLLETNDNFGGDDSFPLKTSIKNILDGDELKEHNSILIVAAGASEDIMIPRQFRGYWVQYRDASKDFPILEGLGTDLTAKARAGELKPILGRETEIAELATSLVKENYNNAFLVGRAGVGKTAIIKGLALAIARGNVPEKLKDVHLFDVPFANIIRDTGIGGSLETKIGNLKEEVKAHKKQVIVFFDEFHQLMSNDTIRNVLKPALADGDFPCVGATTEEEYQQYISGHDPAFEQRFSRINIDELPMKIVQSIMKLQIEQTNKKIQISSSNLEYFYWCAKALDPFKALPRSGEKILGDILEELPAGSMITKDIIKKHFAVGKICLRLSQEKEFRKLQSKLGHCIKGQDALIERVLARIRSHFFLLTKIEKPLVMLFMGPTGTGKTELAIQLGRELWNDESRYLLFNMGAVDHKTSIVGAPPGYVGYEDSSAILNFMSTKDSGIIILDEVEKIGRNTSVTDAFLEIFDKGTTTDNRGHKINCRPFIFILTSNLGQALQPTAEKREKTEILSGEGGFRPEFIGRLQLIEVFGRIGDAEAKDIVMEYIAELGSIADFDCEFEIDDSAVSEIRSRADFQNYGARMLKAKTKEIFDDIIVKNQHQIYHDKTFTISFKDGKFVLVE